MRRRRHLFLILSIVSFLLLWISTDPNSGFISNLKYGAGLLTVITSISGSLLGLCILHFARKALFDYLSADFNKLLEKANDTAVGAGLGAIALAIMTLAVACVIIAGFFAF